MHQSRADASPPGFFLHPPTARGAPVTAHAATARRCATGVDTMLSLSVRGLPRDMTEASLTELFTVHGRVHGLRIARDLFSGECKGFAELSMEGHEARAAIAALNGTTVGTEMIRVGLKSDDRPRRR